MTLLIAGNGITIALSIVVFLLVTLALVTILLYAKKKLTPEGNLKIEINGEKDLIAEPGTTLLRALSENNVFLPSACGGGGSCGLCKCQVNKGGGTILPTETGFFTRKEINESWRLSCQVKLRNDIQIRVPQKILGIKKWECEVVSNKNIATFIKEFIVKLPEGEDLHFRPGEYIQIEVPIYEMKYTDIIVDKEFHDEWDKYDLWSLKLQNKEATFRAYSMANHPAEGNIVKLNVRIATPPIDKNTKTWTKNIKPGICSSYIFSRKKGDKVTISGPFGEFHIRDTEREMLYIGGGAGMAPLRSHLFHLFETLKTSDRKISYWYGARSKREIFYEPEFRELEKEFPNFTFNIALSDPLPEDEWTGYVGFIHQVIFDEYLSKHDAPEDIEYYMCGPGPMANAVKKMLWDLGVPLEMLSFDDFGN